MVKMNAAKLVVACLEAQGVEYVYGIPGAKIDAVFDALEDSSIQLILCRHEQNAAFMAAAYGRVTGKPGVVLVTSGPGVSNLATGLLTATTEGDPIVAIGGNVPRNMSLKESHQNTNNVLLMAPVCKSSVEVSMPENIPEVFANAFRLASAPRSGSCFISLPQDVLKEETSASVIVATPLAFGQTKSTLIDEAAHLINEANFPVLLLGQEASRKENCEALRSLIAKTKLPTVGTFQAAGVIPRELVEVFAGRVGLFRNQPGDKLLNKADVVLTVGLNLVEYDPEIWNAECQKKIIHLDYQATNIHETYQPVIELLGDIHCNVSALAAELKEHHAQTNLAHVKPFHDEHQTIIHSKITSRPSLIHPLDFIAKLRDRVTDDSMVICDIGTIYMWMARYFLAYEPHHLLFSNGQQTLGVALPWAMGVRFAYPDKEIISMSGDGGFLFSAMELENAVRQQQHFIHFVWRDGSYNMVKEQELMKYHRGSGVDFGRVDLVEFASAFGAKGYQLNDINAFDEIFTEASAQTVPVLIDIEIDYSDNPGLFESLNPEQGN